MQSSIGKEEKEAFMLKGLKKKGSVRVESSVVRDWEEGSAKGEVVLAKKESR